MQYKRCELTMEDEQFLKTLCELGFMTFEQIEKYVYRRRSKKIIKRLDKLRQYGLIDRVWRPEKIGTRVFIPCVDKMKFAVDLEIVERALSAKAHLAYQSPNVRHEESVREFVLQVMNLFEDLEFDLDHHLLRKPGFELISSRDENDIRPDAILYLRNEIRVAVEVELHQKTRLRYLRKFRAFREAGILKVIYVTGSRTIAHAVLSASNEMNQPNGSPDLRDQILVADLGVGDVQFRSACELAFEKLRVSGQKKKAWSRGVSSGEEKLTEKAAA